MKDWSRSAEQVMLSAVESGIRTLGIIAPVSGAGTSTVARGVAEAFARAGNKTLLLDLTADLRDDGRPAAWVPGGEDVSESVIVEPSGLAVLRSDANDGSRALFNNVERLQQTFQRELAGYTALVVDLPAVKEDHDNRLNPMAAARVCDAVLMVCLTGHVDRAALNDAVEALRPAGVNLAGLVLNDYYATSLGEDIADATQNGLGRYLPGLARRIGRRALASRFLNDRFNYVR